MLDFVFQNSTRVIFGKTALEMLGGEIAHYGRILLVYGGGSVKKSGLYQAVNEILRKNDCDVYELGGVEPNPRVTTVRRGIELCRQFRVDFVLAVGGGSVIDCAKAVAAGARTTHDVWDLFTGKAKINDAIPLGCILTHAAAGSETSKSSVVTNEELTSKRSIYGGEGSELIRCKFAICNPEYTYTLSREQTAYGIADMMAHIFERYLSLPNDVQSSDFLSEGLLRAIIHNARILQQNPKDYSARANIMWASTVAHNGLLGMGKEQDWMCHRLEHGLSAVYDIAHGAGLAIISPKWMKYVYKTQVDRFAQYARTVFGITGKSPSETALQGIVATRDFFREIGNPTELADVGLDDTAIPAIINHAEKYGAGSFMKIDKKEMFDILKIRI